MTTIQLDDLEAGELSIEFEGCEPWELLEWSFERFGERLAISTSFQEGGVALIDMAYGIDPEVRIFSIDTGRLPEETYELIETLLERYPGLRLELLQPDAGQLQRLVDRNGPNLFRRSVDLRLLCCNVRKVQPLNRALDGLDAWVTALRRDQWASRSDIRKVELDHDHEAIVKLNPLAEWTEEEVWDYIREHDVPVHPLYERGYTSIGCAPCTRAIAPGEPARAGRWWWETNAPKECGMHCAIETGGFEHELHAILGDEAQRMSAARRQRRGARARALRGRGRARRGARGGLPRAPRRDPRGARGRRPGRRGGRCRARAARDDRAPVRPGTRALRAGGEQALLRLYRRLPGGIEAKESAAAVGEALDQLRGKPLEKIGLTAVGPGSHSLTLEAGGIRLLVHLDRNGARLASVETSG